MQLIIKIVISVSMIVVATEMAKKMPSLAGLVAVMPLTGLIVLFWLNYENKSDTALLINYTRGALLGIVPTVLFYLTVVICLSKNVSFTLSIIIGFMVWISGAVVHHLLFK